MRQRPKRDVAEEITNLIIKTIEAGTLPWRRPWKMTANSGQSHAVVRTDSKLQPFSVLPAEEGVPGVIELQVVVL